MLIRHLRFFVTLAEVEHFGRAAEMCNVTQPTLSQAIRKLEEDLALVLIIRGHRFTALTPEGEKVLRWGRQILTDYDNLHDDLNGARRGGLTGTLRLGVIPTAMPLVSYLSEEFAALNPLAHIEVRAMSSREIEKGLANFEIDGGITYLDNEPLSHVVRFALYEEEYVFACPKDHPLAACKTVTWKEAVAQPLCLLSADMQHRRILDNIAASVGVKLAPQIVSNSFPGVAAHLRSGIWCSIVPQTFALVFDSTNYLALQSLSGPTHNQAIGLVLADRAPQSPMSNALQACVESAHVTQRFKGVYGKSAAPLRMQRVMAG